MSFSTNNEKRDQETQARIAAYPKDAVVRVKDPDATYNTATANKLRDRLGVITGHGIPYGSPLVTFPAVGRRQELRQSFQFGAAKELEIVTDLDAIAKWREEVQKTADRAAALLKKKQAVKKAASKTT